MANSEEDLLRYVVQDLGVGAEDVIVKEEFKRKSEEKRRGDFIGMANLREIRKV